MSNPGAFTAALSAQLAAQNMMQAAVQRAGAAAILLRQREGGAKPAPKNAKKKK